ncbi:hypothetical protein E2562_016147 [Oryza meyeriana var. granulata]|uniref:Uncharacterized protein n=1 Tax=Oryza meyeriana var. granulata TaxID=110450 RepID=A0A6G1F8R5_9ORYZ|nr:hypothetical protein E2562_016147 [Oryza meyeriana var. granulata]
MASPFRWIAMPGRRPHAQPRASHWTQRTMPSLVLLRRTHARADLSCHKCRLELSDEEAEQQHEGVGSRGRKGSEARY